MLGRSKAAAVSVVFFVGASCATAQNLPFTVTEVADFEMPWALEFLPDGRLLVTEQRGALKLYESGTVEDLSGVPEVAFGGQGGLGDVVLHPDFATNNLVYLSYAEAGERGTRGAAVARAKLVLESGGGALTDLDVIWRQVPKVDGAGHYGQRIAFGGGYLWISSGERQKFDPAQDMQANLGKILRLNYDGSVPADNPFADRGGVTAQIWSLGHRNPLGLAFDSAGRLWNVEMGPQGGDELNLVVRGANYGYPIVSNGDHYDGTPIPDHPTRPEFNAPAVFWNPVISPSSLMFYSGSEFPQWRGDAFIGGLSSQSIVHIEFEGTSAREAERFAMGMRIRAVEQGPDGAIWILEDGRDGRGGQGRMFRLTARSASDE
ncbi:MAG TPA: PQQ-dependent sugar dehydrogenase [Gammaproteobacteria bacterium]|jgi:glucose/arabinose dehydrogenase